MRRERGVIQLRDLLTIGAVAVCTDVTLRSHIIWILAYEAWMKGRVRSLAILHHSLPCLHIYLPINLSSSHSCKVQDTDAVNAKKARSFHSRHLTAKEQAYACRFYAWGLWMAQLGNLLSAGAVPDVQVVGTQAGNRMSGTSRRLVWAPAPAGGVLYVQRLENTGCFGTPFDRR